ncbi:MAG: hypothetical protein E7667_06170 [Ruminococcaceae bacterium]|nr:hypothetical protein [Oscillospiraceae bacterium]
MNSILKKSLAFALAVLMLPLVSCSNRQTEQKATETETEQRLVIEDVFTPYTDQDKQRITSRLLGVFSAAVKVTGGELTEEQVMRIQKRIEESIIPFLEFSRVSPEQVEKVIPEKFTSADLMNVYWVSVSVIGSEQAGRLFYEFASLYLESKAAEYSKLYADSGEDIHLEYAKRYAQQRWEMENKLGEESFVAASNFIFSCVSSIKKNGMSAGIGNLMQGDVAGAVLSVIRRQSAEAARLPLDSEQWGIAAEIIFEIIIFDVNPTESMGELQLSCFENMSHRADAANAIGQSIPDILSLYAQVAHKMTSQEMALILSKNKLEMISGICSALLRGEKRFIEWVQKIEQIEIDGAEDYLLIEAAGLADEYEKYAATRQEVTAEELFEFIRQCADRENKDAQAKLLSRVEDFLFSVAPYYTFIFMNDF